MKPVENGFTEVAEIPVRHSYSFPAVREEGCRLGQIDTLFGQKMRHPLGRLLLEPMHEGKHIPSALSRQAFADDEFKPTFLPGWGIGRFDVRAIDANSLQWMALAIRTH